MHFAAPPFDASQPNREVSLAEALPRPPPRGPKCSHCGCRVVGVRRCSRCRKAVFCSHACLKAAWPEHKKECRPAQAEAEQTES